ncbi:tRNA (adenosine(37)-N6)-threonylcarbamoyltransferase complex dimerization subunit type 1 TsaB [Edaphobacter sp.]|uniref:tRNA (adenosine(37)-N6)-threonylcarbamoyltransferase complex dimerization subunit type 1 TsaB n=1 Tax=Edaphobacter sp. TaxID=1934404 RepID=UPI002DB8AA3E|nr:tRNA (adenosine(37)-N6)-threonylcarbamoyltransferase complex dimerization subunit type 1 TsaB [Edaphobacter sp.]HEU5342397.1 tRNA (adenosine(37)-N6)-threonylcarbamoyltransferase complex dimerization subunit type 1 TsaB [Edaphobacter sp.]
MRFLLIHTAGAEGSVALATEAGVVASEVLPGRSSSEHLVSAVRRLMETAGWGLRELKAVVVVHGPGSFTGVRVGLSAAKGLCGAGEVPLIAVSRLALLAGETGYSALDAGRGEFYFGEYAGQRMLRETLLSRDALRAAVGSGEVTVCELKVAEALAGLRVKLVDEPLAETVLPLALERVRVGEFDDVAVADANYLRQTDLEILAKAKMEGQAR